jgi:hypothetical protein
MRGEGSEKDRTISPWKSGFNLIVDGMIVNSVAELIQDDQQTERIRRLCHASYERSLEDFAFAVVYGSKLVTSKDFRGSVTTPDQPGVELAARLGEICEQGVYPAEISEGRLLLDGAYCEKIRADIEQFARCVVNPRLNHFFRDYMVREASKHLGNDSSLFQNDLEPEKYNFDTRRPYYQNRSLQDALGQPATDSLVRFLPISPHNSRDKYALKALKEFATRNVLSLITIMWESDAFASDTNSWRLPHILRALVRQKSLYSVGTMQQEHLRDMVVQHALGTAFRHMRRTRTEHIVTILLNQRDEPPFKQIRQILEQEHLLFFTSDPRNEERAIKILRLIKSSATSATYPLDPDYLSLEQRSALRKLRMDSKDYEAELYRVFPALRPPE